MSLIPYPLTRPFLFALDAELAHELTIQSLAASQCTPLALAYAQKRVHDPITLAGLRFPNRVGLAAGLDKNARCIDAWDAMGFGFVELGTVTPLGQSGNLKPRMFRIPEKQALINRLGFNNEGLTAFLARIAQAKRRRISPMLWGLNIGKNAATPIEHAASDYLTGLSAVYALADYITINISSPNTQNLRSLQSDQALNDLLAAITERRMQLTQECGQRKPIFLKIAPDLDEGQIQLIALTLTKHDIDGVIATNTTIAREAVQGCKHAEQSGGLSGAPLLQPSNAVIAQLRQALGPHYPIIGVGGVCSGADAISKIRAGADLVQIYTGLIYRGPALVREAAQALAQNGKA